MAPKLSKMKTSPRNKAPLNDDLESTLHNIDQSVPAINRMQALGPIKQKAVAESAEIPKEKEAVESSYISEDDNMKSDAEGADTGPVDSAGAGGEERLNEILPKSTQLTTNPSEDDLNAQVNATDIIESEGQPGFHNITDMPDSDDEMYQLSEEGGNQTSRPLLNADEYAELTQERARENRIKQQLFSTAVKIMYTDRGSSASMESRLHRAISLGNEEQVRQVIS